MIPTPLKQVDSACPNCTSTGMSIIYDLKQVPVHSVLLHSSREEAMGLAKGDIRLGYCPACGFISNLSFDPDLQNYFTQKYEATQAYSDTFNTFHKNLAIRLINQYDLHDKSIVEIGCGQGEFLDLLCGLGGNSGVGFDPAYFESRRIDPKSDRVTIFKDFYTEQSLGQLMVDFVCCKMTLEHIHEPYKFLNIVANSLRNQPDTIVFFQVPNAHRILQEVAFWDIYYEHCSYFSQNSLNFLFQLCGFHVIKNTVDYDGQHLLIEARLTGPTHPRSLARINDLSEFEIDVHNFQLKHPDAISGLKDSIGKLFSSGNKIAIWGGSSKTVAFLTTLKIQDEVEYVVDINPNKHGTYIAGTGQQIVPYEFLKSYKPDTIIVMNPIYIDEIKETINGIGLSCNLVSINNILEESQSKYS